MEENTRTRHSNDTSLQVLVEDLVSSSRQKLEDVTVYLNSLYLEEECSNPIGILPSTGEDLHITSRKSKLSNYAKLV